MGRWTGKRARNVAVAVPEGGGIPRHLRKRSDAAEGRDRKREVNPSGGASWIGDGVGETWNGVGEGDDGVKRS